MQLYNIPLVLEKIIINYKIGLESFEKHKKIMQECVKEIDKINYSYIYDIESECYEGIMINGRKQTMYYIHNCGDYEIETSFIGKDTYNKYYLFKNNRLIQFEDNNFNF